jgi:transcriptional regulator with XRE-family HTH domain
MNTSDDFRQFLDDWLTRTGVSQNDLSFQVGIGQGVISRWLHPEERRRTRPTPESLEKLAPVVGKSYGELMILAGWWPRPHLPNEAGQPEDSPMLQAAIAILRDGFFALSDRPGERELRLDLTQELWHQPRRKGRPRKQSRTTLGSDERLDNDKSHSVRYHLIGIT